MTIYFGKFIHTENGRMIMSVLLGFGLASLFRKVCKDKNCLTFRAAPIDEFKDKIFRTDKGCVKYMPVPAKCSLNNAKIISFE